MATAKKRKVAPSLGEGKTSSWCIIRYKTFEMKLKFTNKHAQKRNLANFSSWKSVLETSREKRFAWPKEEFSWIIRIVQNELTPRFNNYYSHSYFRKSANKKFILILVKFQKPLQSNVLTFARNLGPVHFLKKDVYPTLKLVWSCPVVVHNNLRILNPSDTYNNFLVLLCIFSTP
jgi:hypothetical protein